MIEIIIALISGLCVAIPSVIATICSNNLTKYKVDELRKEVAEHNNFAKRMPVVEEQIKNINIRLDKIEKR